jgi:hypothetical protein
MSGKELFQIFHRERSAFLECTMNRLLHLEPLIDQHPEPRESLDVKRPISHDRRVLR